MANKYGFWRVQGNSMEPVIESGAFVLVLPCRGLPIGKLVLVDHPHYGQLVKRLKSIDEKGLMLLQGDGEDSLTTEQMGPVCSSRLKGRVCWQSRPTSSL